MLLSLEAEWVVLSEAVKEIMIMIQLLRCMKMSVKLPVMVRVDNIGAISMASNIITMTCSKHVDTRNKYVNKYLEERVVKIIFLSLLKITTFSKNFKCKI